MLLHGAPKLDENGKPVRDSRGIVGNCDSTLFLGGKEKGTLREISELLGKETIDSLSQSENRGAQTSHGLSYQKSRWTPTPTSPPTHSSRRRKRWGASSPVLSDGFRYPLPLGSAFGAGKSSIRN